MGKKWVPTVTETRQADLITLTDMEVHVDAFFVHGNSFSDDDLQRRLIAVAAKAYREGLADRIVLNGTTKKMFKESHKIPNHPTFDDYLQMLLEQEVPRDAIIILNPPLLTTPAETRALLKKAKSEGWNKLIIESVPWHQLRCFLQTIALMCEFDFEPLVFNRTFSGTDWFKPSVRAVMGGTSISESYLWQIEPEDKRIVKYAEKSTEWVRHVTIPEMLDYVKRRNKLITSACC